MRNGTICRTCRGSRQPMRPIWTTRKRVKGNYILCADMLSTCAPGTIGKKNDDFPTHICSVCYRKLCLAYKFRLQCESSYSHFANYSVDEVKVEFIKKEKHDDEHNSIGQEEDKPDLRNEHEILADTSRIDIIDGELKLENGVNNNIDFVDGDNDDGDDDDDDDDDEDEDDDSMNDYDDELIQEMKSKMAPKVKSEHKRLKKRHKTLAKIKKRRLLKLEEHDDSIKEKNLITCTLCPKTFRYKTPFLAHQDWHLGIKRYFCDICQKSYRNEADHKRMHRRGMKFTCELCAKSFNTKSKLAVHKEIHAEERARFPCEVEGCGKFFLSLNGLERHKLTHVGMKNFICQMCSKRFFDKYQLELHIRTHTNDRRHSCSFCDKKFITTSARNSHEKWHMKMKNYVCQHCEKAFVTSSGLKRHLLCHTKEQPEVCRFCGKKFARFDNRKRHEMAMHYISEKST